MSFESLFLPKLFYDSMISQLESENISECVNLLLRSNFFLTIQHYHYCLLLYYRAQNLH